MEVGEKKSREKSAGDVSERKNNDSLLTDGPRGPCRRGVAVKGVQKTTRDKKPKTTTSHGSGRTASDDEPAGARGISCLCDGPVSDCRLGLVGRAGRMSRRGARQWMQDERTTGRGGRGEGPRRLTAQAAETIGGVGVVLRRKSR